MGLKLLFFEGPMCHITALVKGLLQKLPFKLEALTTKVAFKSFEYFFISLFQKNMTFVL
jgi:hypothetical protein